MDHVAPTTLNCFVKTCGRSSNIRKTPSVLHQHSSIASNKTLVVGGHTSGRVHPRSLGASAAFRRPRRLSHDLFATRTVDLWDCFGSPLPNWANLRSCIAGCRLYTRWGSLRATPAMNHIQGKRRNPRRGWKKSGWRTWQKRAGWA